MHQFDGKDAQIAAEASPLSDSPELDMGKKSSLVADPAASFEGCRVSVMFMSNMFVYAANLPVGRTFTF